MARFRGFLLLNTIYWVFPIWGNIVLFLVKKTIFGLGLFALLLWTDFLPAQEVAPSNPTGTLQALESQPAGSASSESDATASPKNGSPQSATETTPPPASSESENNRTPLPPDSGLSTTGILKGKVPVAPKKPMATVKDYGAGPAFKVLPPDPSASAVWVGAGQPPLDPEKTQVLRVG